MSRDAEFRRARERAAIEGRVGRAIAEGDATVFPKDRFGQAITRGSQILFRPTFDFVYMVYDVVPVIDPTVPAGHVKMTLRSETTITVPAGQPLMQAVKIMTAPEPVPLGGAPEGTDHGSDGDSAEQTSESKASAQGDGDHGEAPSKLVLTDVQ